jgi:hypothetical protein
LRRFERAFFSTSVQTAAGRGIERTIVFRLLPFLGCPRQRRVVRELGHLPQGQERRACSLARPGEGVSPDRTEALEIDFGVEGIRRLVAFCGLMMRIATSACTT